MPHSAWSSCGPGIDFLGQSDAPSAVPTPTDAAKGLAWLSLAQGPPGDLGSGSQALLDLICEGKVPNGQLRQTASVLSNTELQT